MPRYEGEDGADDEQFNGSKEAPATESPASLKKSTLFKVVLL
jgi:hypothetical protein